MVLLRRHGIQSKDMRQAISGDNVLVNYTGTLDDGTEFDSSVETGPIEITIGSGRFFSGIENALIGMTVGDTKKVTLEPEDAFGSYNPQLIHNFERELIPPEIKLEIGTVLEAKNESGEVATHS